MSADQLVLLENCRIDKGEKKNSEELARKLAAAGAQEPLIKAVHKVSCCPCCPCCRIALQLADSVGPHAQAVGLIIECLWKRQGKHFTGSHSELVYQQEMRRQASRPQSVRSEMTTTTR